MCGIVGILGIEHLHDISSCNDYIAHRGPDDSGIFIEKNLAFAHRRLSIQDLSPLGHQPMISSDGRYTLIFNGEIYNHFEIRKELENEYSFKSKTSDTETLLYGFAKFKEELFNKLNGIFALAIYDNVENTVTITRDQFGVKPLYFYQKDNNLLFSSELKAISNIKGIDKTIDYSALVNYLTFLWSPGSQTPFQNVKKLEAGHYIKVDLNNIAKFKIVKYYSIPFNGSYAKASESELIEQLDVHLTNAVKRQMLSDVPVGFFLSGGLDSSGITAMARKIFPNRHLPCYTIDSNAEDGMEGLVDDLKYAKLVAEKLKLDLRIVDGKQEIMDRFSEMIYHLDEPQADTAPINVLNICEQARKDGIYVLLGGTAGDDLFSGYRRHQALQYEPILQNIPKFISRKSKKFLSKLSSDNPTIRRLRKVFNNADKPQIERLIGYYKWLDSDLINSLFTEEVKVHLDGYKPEKIFINALKEIPDEKNNLNRMLFWELKYFLTDHNLNYTDKLSMAAGVEVRVPFLDLELLEFSTTIPPRLKLKGQRTKYLLKKVMEKYLPKEVIYRPKTGFGSPVREWITGANGSELYTDLNSALFRNRKIFNVDAVQNLIEANQSNKIDASYSILSLMAIEKWFQKFVDSNQVNF